MRKDSEATKELLHQIALHLSSRPECKRIEYIVSIDNNVISMYPYIEVLPNRFWRKRKYKTSVVEHVLKHHMKDTTELVSGVYVYQLSSTNMKRRWIRIE